MADTFEALFGGSPDVVTSAPGRVNLIGEHTDYNHGLVLPTAIPLCTQVQLARRTDNQVRAWSEAMADQPPGQYEIGQEHAGRGWLDYVQGVTQSLARRGKPVGGFDVRISSDVPVGSGLSSSAALEVALLRALRQVFGLQLDDVELALTGQQAENELVGAPVGIMDQMASSLLEPGQALFLDTDTLATQRLPLPSCADLVVIDSGLHHAHASGGYRQRREECEEAARLLGVKSLRELGPADMDRLQDLPETLGRRARHVISENARVLAARRAIWADDCAALGLILFAAHASLREDFDVSLPPIDLLVRLAEHDSRVLGARLTGGGFGGSVLVLTDRGSGAEVGEELVQAYRKATGLEGRMVIPQGKKS